jgi:hypothetical protein
MADKQPPQTTMPPVTLPPPQTTMPPMTMRPPVLPEGTAIGALGGPEIAFGEADEKKFSIGFKQEGKGGNVHLFVDHPDGKKEYYSAAVSSDGKYKGTTHGEKTELRVEDSIKDWALKLRTNEREQAAKAGPIIALAKKIYNQDSPGVITPDEFLNIYKAFQALGPAEVPNTPAPPTPAPIAPNAHAGRGFVNPPTVGEMAAERAAVFAETKVFVTVPPSTAAPGEFQSHKPLVFVNIDAKDDKALKALSPELQEKVHVAAAKMLGSVKQCSELEVGPQVSEGMIANALAKGVAKGIKLEDLEQMHSPSAALSCPSGAKAPPIKGGRG